MLPCDICGKQNHVWFNCPQRATKPEGWKPERLAPSAKPDEPVASVAKIGRPRIHPDRKAYKAEREREYRKRRAAQKAAQ